MQQLVNSDTIIEFFTASIYTDVNTTEEFYYSTVNDLIADLAPKIGLEEATRFIDRPEFFLGAFNPTEQSPSGMAQVLVSDGAGRAAGAPRIELSVTAAHELYGHALRWAQGKPWQHDGGPVDEAIREIERRTRGQ